MAAIMSRIESQLAAQVDAPSLPGPPLEDEMMKIQPLNMHCCNRNLTWLDGDPLPSFCPFCGETVTTEPPDFVECEFMIDADFARTNFRLHAHANVPGYLKYACVKDGFPNIQAAKKWAKSQYPTAKIHVDRSLRSSHTMSEITQDGCRPTYKDRENE